MPPGNQVQASRGVPRSNKSINCPKDLAHRLSVLHTIAFGRLRPGKPLLFSCISAPCNGGGEGVGFWAYLLSKVSAISRKFCAEEGGDALSGAMRLQEGISRCRSGSHCISYVVVAPLDIYDKKISPQASDDEQPSSRIRRQVQAMTEAWWKEAVIYQVIASHIRRLRYLHRYSSSEISY